MFSSKKLVRSVALSACLIVTFALSYVQFDTISGDAGLFKRLEYLMYDTRFNLSLALKPKFENPHNIIIVDIDETSLLKEGRWPWSRDKVALMIDQLANAGALVVTFDVLFSEKQINPTDRLIEVLNKNDQPNIADQLTQFRSQTDYDLALSEAMSQIDVVLSILFGEDEAFEVGQLPMSLIINEQIDVSRLMLRNAHGFTSNLPVLMDSAIGAGFFVPSVDTDGIIRSVPLIQKYNDKVYPSLALATGMAYYVIEDISINSARLNQFTDIVQSIGFVDQTIKTGAIGDVLVPFAGPQKTYPYISASKVLTGEGLEQFENSIVFVGTSAVGLSDLRSTPVGTQYPGVEVHANLLDGLLSDHFPYTPDLSGKLMALIMVIIGLVFSIWLHRFGAMNILGLTVAMILLHFGSNFYFWHYYALNLPMAVPLILLMSLGVVNFIEGYVKEGQSKKKISNMFGQYVPQAHIEKMLSSQGEYGFDGENKVLTVLFLDIRSFTTISEQLSATQLKNLLNDFFTPITEIIFNNQGTIDKYVGDMVMAFWGAPIDDDRHALNAVHGAMAMQEMVIQLKPEFDAKGYPDVQIGIGLNTGPMNVGDMGSSFRRAYTVLGDSVNLGSRLESLTKFYGAQIIIGPDTYEQTKDTYACRLIDKIQVKGKDEPIVCYEPVCLLQNCTAELQTELDDYHHAYQLYCTKQWGEAEIELTKLEKNGTRAFLYRLYLERIVELKEQDLEDAWDGTYRHTSK
ncbi:CHASE2 domain-containing protein [Marinicellulosiphila megalodicopiae]|uniref:CHASE2 domain-containing protein n=1 Tax=Marinicellulosiphila megalodicopiae TaxID=2724896 RepID=UPI003BB0872E